MANTATLTIDATNFNKMVRDLAAIDPAIDFNTVLNHEVAAVNTAAIRGTNAAKASQIRADHETREWITLDGTTFKLAWRFTNDRWGEIKTRRRASLQTKLNARGLAKRSWVSAYGTLGLPPDPKIPGYVLKANYNGAQRVNSATERIRGRPGTYGIRLSNFSPYIATPGAGGRRALIRAVNGRVGYFRRNMETGFYRNLQKRAAKYPGVFVR